MKWCFSCCEPELPDIELNMNCPSACCVKNISDNETPQCSTQANEQRKKKLKKKKHGRKRAREEEKVE